MTSEISPLGPPLWPPEAGKPRVRIATAFPRFEAIVTLPGIHATQIDAFVDSLNRRRAADGLPPLSPDEERAIRDDAVALTVENEIVHIRPNPEDMPQAFQADKLLQRIVSKRRIKFINVLNEKVREAVKRRGECWRIAPLPTSAAEMAQRIVASKIAIHGREIYYYNSATGTRVLTCDEFSRLRDLDNAELRRHLAEIAEFCQRFNLQHNPEIAFFMAGRPWAHQAFDPWDFARMDDAQLRAVHEELCRGFRAAVEPAFREDNLDSSLWRNRMFSALIAETDEIVPEETLLALSPEFFMQVQWLPGGRVVRGELMFDEVFEEEHLEPFEENAREFLYNLIREYEDLEYVNIGRVVNSLSQRPQRRGRRKVYIAVIKQHGREEETVNILRMQKWGVREHLNDGIELPIAMYKSDEYTEYVLDRRLACRYLGMNVPRKITARKICERYPAPWAGPNGLLIWSPYFERAYIGGIATDKLPRHKFQDAEFARRFARLLGLAAAPNIIVGKCDSDGKVLFDDGDEVLIEDAEGMPAEIFVADPSGAFCDFRRALQVSAPAYAEPILRRIDWSPNPEEFAHMYLDAFVEHFLSIQDKYRRRRGASEMRFKKRPYSEDGSFACRWEKVLKRLDRTDPRELAEIIRARLPAHVGC